MGLVGVSWGRLGSVRIGSDRFGSVRIGSDRFGCTGPASERILVPGRTPSGPQRAVQMRQGRCASLRIATDRCLENLVGVGVCLDAPNRPNDTKETFTMHGQAELLKDKKYGGFLVVFEYFIFEYF